MRFYGLVSTGDVWQFAHLQYKRFIRDPRSFAISDLPELFRTLQYVFEQTKARVSNEVSAVGRFTHLERAVYCAAIVEKVSSTLTLPLMIGERILPRARKAADEHGVGLVMT